VVLGRHHSLKAVAGGFGVVARRCKAGAKGNLIRLPAPASLCGEAGGGTEEDRRLFTTAPWKGEYRWFRSPNVICLEKYRQLKALGRI
jgi:hypothetical protein